MNFSYVDDEEKLKLNTLYNIVEETDKNKTQQSLLNVLKTEKNNKLKEMITDFINYNKNIKETENLTEQNNTIFFKNTLYSYLHKNLVETIYIIDKERQNERINKLYLWYKDKIKCFDELKYMKIKSYISPDEIDDEKYVNNKFNHLFEKRKKYMSSTDRVLKEMKHRNKELYNKKSLQSLNEYKRKHIMKMKNNEKLFWKMYSGMEKCKPLERKNFFKSNDDKDDKDKKHDISLPFLNYYILKADKDIIESKNKLFAEKTSKEDNEKTINEFGKNKAKYRTNLINKYEIKDLINNYIKTNNFNSILLKKYNTNESGCKEKTDEEESKNKTFLNNLSSLDDNDVENLGKNDNIIINKIFNHNKENVKEEDKKSESESIGIKRKKRKSNTERMGKSIKKFLKTLGKKVIIEDVKNLDNKTNIIIDQRKENIISNIIFLKDSTNNVNNELVLNNCLNNTINIPSDSISKLTYHNNLFKQKLLYKRLLDIPIKKERSSNSTIQHYPLEKNSFGDNYEFIDRDKIENNINLSAYNLKKNIIGKRKDFEYFSIFRNKKNINDKVKKYRINNSYNLYKDNYLNLRKTLSSFRKKEYEEFLDYTKRKRNDEIMDEINSSNCINKTEQKNNKKETRESNESLDSKILFRNKIYINRDKRQKILSNAFFNPNESNTFSKYFLPRTGSMLLNRSENIKK